MKKIIIFSLLVFSSFLFIGCNKLNNQNNPTKETQTNEDNNSSSKDNTKDDKDTNKDNTTDSKDNGTNTHTNEGDKSNSNPVKGGDDKKITKKICRIYGFNRDELQLYYFNEEITVEDKALVKALTKALQNNLPNDNFLALTDKAQVTSAKLDQETGVLTVVFSENFLRYMVLGTSTESGLMASLINTYAYNYNVDKVAIYFGDTLYTSLKGSLEEGYFTAHLKDAKEYTK